MVVLPVLPVPAVFRLAQRPHFHFRTLPAARQARALVANHLLLVVGNDTVIFVAADQSEPIRGRRGERSCARGGPGERRNCRP